MSSPRLLEHRQELKDAVEDVSRHRDAALRKVKTLEALERPRLWMGFVSVSS